MEIDQLSSELATKMDEVGPALALPIAILSLILFFQGHRRLQIVTMVIGAAIGYVMAPSILPTVEELGIALTPLQTTGIICLVFGFILSASVMMSTRLLTSAFIFITFSTGIQTLNNYGFDVERSELWSGVAALAALFFTMGLNRILPSIFSAIFAAYGLILAGLLATSNQVSTFEPVEVKTFIMMLPILLFSLFMQKIDVKKLAERELAKDQPDQKTLEAQQHFLKL
jgi:predicted acyltransferase|tara:strand:+ start:3262 stop:3945 length:684 start_codon:yes stop_codon:yes gene_type:complete